MSSLPPGPPPSSPPPSSPPPSGPPSGPPPGAETLEYGGGGPIPPEPATGKRGGGRRRLFLIGGGVIGLGAVGAAAFGAWWYVSTGPQPAEALPADTIGYVSLDLDPSGGQKLDALRTLKRLPAADDALDLSGDVSDIDIKKVLVEEILKEAPCDLRYGDDVEPWLGDRGAVAAVDTGADEPAPVFVLQVTDADAAVDGLEGLFACGEEDSTDQPGIEVVDDEWVLLAETPEIASEVADRTADGSLADDETFQQWTEAAGDPGIVTAYAAPAAGAFLAENLEDLLGPMMSMAGVPDPSVSLPTLPDEDLADMSPEELEEYLSSYDDLGSDEPLPGDAMTDEMTKALQEFGGAAVTLRFDDGALEIESAVAPTSDVDLPDGTGADALESLPEDTAAAIGIGFGDDWFDQLVASAAQTLGEDEETLLSDLEDVTGLTLPDDAETLLGDSFVLALGGGLDPEAMEAADGSDVPVALKVLGDPDEIETVLDKLRPQLAEAGAPESLLATSSEGDAIAFGPNESYRDDVLANGDLGDSDVYQDVVPDENDAAAVIFVDLDEVTRLVREVGGLGDDDEVLSNIEPLRALGISAWVDDDSTSHAMLRISTDDD